MNPEPFYGGLLGKIAFDVDMKAAGHTQAEIDSAWNARFPEPAEQRHPVSQA